MRLAPGSRLRLRVVALGYLAAVLLRPGRRRRLQDLRARPRRGLGQSITTPAAIHAFWLTIKVDGDRRAAQHDLRHRRRRSCSCAAGSAAGASLEALIDLPFAVSPVVIGLSLVLLYGRERLVRADADRRRHPDHLLAARASCWRRSSSACRSSCARSRRCCARSATSRSRPRRRSAPAAGRRSGASRCRRSAGAWPTASCCPTARAIGEFGAVSVVSGKISGETETLTLLVEKRFNELRPRRAPTRPRRCWRSSRWRPCSA